MPAMWEIDTWMCAWSVIHAASSISGPTALKEISFPLLSQVSVTLLFNIMDIFSRGDIPGAKSWR